MWRTLLVTRHTGFSPRQSTRACLCPATLFLNPHTNRVMSKFPITRAKSAPPQSITPRWLTYKQAAIYSGLGTRVLENHVRAGFIRSSNACAPGATRGRRLLDRLALDQFIESGVGKAPSVLAMNKKHNG